MDHMVPTILSRIEKKNTALILLAVLELCLVQHASALDVILHPGISLSQTAIQEQYGKIDRAVELLRKAIKGVDSAEVKYHLAYALSKQGSIEEAKALLDEALSANQSFNGIEDARKLQKKLL
jgi:tetratricopeptide (TPR) repeat protein